jgi:hypothetical protein
MFIAATFWRILIPSIFPCTLKECWDLSQSSCNFGLPKHGSGVQFPMSLGFFNWHNPYNHIMSLGLTLPLTETTTRKRKVDKQTNIWAATACYWDSFTFYSNELFNINKSMWYITHEWVSFVSVYYLLFKYKWMNNWQTTPGYELCPSSDLRVSCIIFETVLIICWCGCVK